VPFLHNQIALCNAAGDTWSVLESDEIELVLSGLTANLCYDVFAWNSGALDVELVAWLNATTRATALATLDGVTVKSGDPSRRYLGTICAISATTIGDTENARRVWNENNRVMRAMRTVSVTASYTYSINTWRLAESADTQKFFVVIGRSLEPLRAYNIAQIYNSGVAGSGGVAIGIDSTTAPASLSTIALQAMTVASKDFTLGATFNGLLAPGFHYVARLEKAVASGVTTWYQNSVNTFANMQGSIPL